jgi:hypothetical protein
MHLLNMILKMRHARRRKDYSLNFADKTGFFTARIRYKFITVNTFHIIPQFVNRA